MGLFVTPDQNPQWTDDYYYGGRIAGSDVAGAILLCAPHAGRSHRPKGAGRVAIQVPRHQDCDEQHRGGSEESCMGREAAVGLARLDECRCGAHCGAESGGRVQLHIIRAGLLSPKRAAV